MLPSLLIAALLTTAADWPRWRGPDLDGISRETGWRSDWLDADPPIAWKANVGIGFSAVSVADGRLYTMGNEDNLETVYCLNAETGEPIWTHEYECALEPRFFEGGPTSTPTVDGNRVYTVSREGHLFCFDAASGDVAWERHLPDDFEIAAPGWGFACSPLILGDRLLLNAGASGLMLEKATGEVVWKSEDVEAGYSTPIPFEHGDRKLVMLTTGKSFLAAGLETGEEVWSVRWLTRYGVNAADPIVSGDTVFISSGYGKGGALLRLTDGEPEEVWKNKEMENQMNPCVLIDGHLYGISGNEDAKPELRCVEMATGETKWSEKGIGLGAVAAADGKLIVISGYGELIMAPASPEGFEDTARVQVLSGKCWTVPVLANGRLYCRNAEGDLVCIDLKK